MEPHVCLVANRSSDRRGEYVEIANGSNVPVALTGLELTDYTIGQRHVHVSRFPTSSDGGILTLSAGSVAYVFSSHGTNELLADGSLLLFAGRSAPIWNNDGDVAYLRRTDGTFVDSRTVGDPKRHPNGH